MADITPNTPNPVREDSYKTELATKLGIDAQYIPSSPVWRNEEEIAAIAEMFSNMTAGSSGGGVLVVHWNNDYTVLDKTGQDILTAVQTGPVFLIDIGDLEDGGEVGTYMLQGVYKENGVYDFAFSNRSSAVNARCSSLSDYPEYYEP